MVRWFTYTMDLSFWNISNGRKVSMIGDFVAWCWLCFRTTITIKTKSATHVSTTKWTRTNLTNLQYEKKHIPKTLANTHSRENERCQSFTNWKLQQLGSAIPKSEYYPVPSIKLWLQRLSFDVVTWTHENRIKFQTINKWWNGYKNPYCMYVCAIHGKSYACWDKSISVHLTVKNQSKAHVKWHSNGTNTNTNTTIESEHDNSKN